MSDLRRAAASLLLNHLAKGIDERSAELRRQIREHESRHRPAALRPLPYSHEMGPTGNPKTFGIVGGGNKSGGASPGVHTRASAKKNGRLPAAYWDPAVADQNRHFDALRKQRSRIKANGGKRKPPHRPRTITAEQEQRVRDLLTAGVGINKAAKTVGIGISGVQRIKREMADPIPQHVRLTNEGKITLAPIPQVVRLTNEEPASIESDASTNEEELT
jgi:hypothetical protein